MSVSRRSYQHARALPMIVVAVAGLMLGLLLASHERSADDGDGKGTRADGSAPEAAVDGALDEAGEAELAEARVAEEAQLETLQGELANTQMLPSDFRTVPAFTLIGTDAEPVDETVFDDRWSLVFFGYTQCPDVCPITLSVMKDVVARLEDAGTDPMQVVFMTVDPVRDTADRMQEYIGFFDPSFVGITGELADVHELTRALGIVASFTANEETPEAYVVDHTASMLLIDPERRVRAKFSAPHEVDNIVADYTAIRAALN